LARVRSGPRPVPEFVKADEASGCQVAVVLAVQALVRSDYEDRSSANTLREHFTWLWHNWPGVAHGAQQEILDGGVTFHQGGHQGGPKRLLTAARLAGCRGRGDPSHLI